MTNDNWLRREKNLLKLEVENLALSESEKASDLLSQEIRAGLEEIEYSDEMVEERLIAEGRAGYYGRAKKEID